MNKLTTAPRSRAAVASPLDSTITGASSLATSLEARTVEVAKGLYKFRPDAQLSEAERHDLSRTIVAIDAALRRATDIDHIEECFEQLDAVRVSANRAPDANRASGGWLVILGDLPRAALGEAVFRIMRNEAPGVPARFMPTPDQIAEVAREIVRAWQFQRARAERLLRLQTAVRVVEPQPSEAEMAATRAKIRRLVDGALPDRAVRRGALAPAPSPAARVKAETDARRAERRAE